MKKASTSCFFVSQIRFSEPVSPIVQAHVLVDGGVITSFKPSEAGNRSPASRYSYDVTVKVTCADKDEIENIGYYMSKSENLAGSDPAAFCEVSVAVPPGNTLISLLALSILKATISISP